MGVNDYGTGTDSLASPSLADWAASVAAALNNSDTSVNDRLSAWQYVVDAKGDLLVGSANDTISRLAVGTNTYVLTADSNEALGMKWAAAAAGGVTPFQTPQVGEWLGVAFPGNGVSMGPFTGSGSMTWFILPTQCTFDRLSARIATGDSNSPLIKPLIYSSGTNGYPSTLVHTGAPMDCSVGSTDINNTVNLTLSAGKYWYGAIGTGGTGAYRIRGITQPNPSPVDSRSFNELGVSGTTALQVDLGTYASPRATITSANISYNYNYNGGPYFGLRRSS